MSSSGTDRRGVRGLELSRDFYAEVVRPILSSRFPDLRHSAALIGPGSEVLGYDDDTSTDHHWGPRVLLFVPAATPAATRDAVRSALADELPLRFRGYSTSFTAPDPNDHGTQLPDDNPSRPLNHRVEIADLPGWLNAYLALDTSRPLSAADWLSIPQQKLLTVVAGEVFHDGLPEQEVGEIAAGAPQSTVRAVARAQDATVVGDPSVGGARGDAPTGALTLLRAALVWYPDDVWRYQLAAAWARVGQEEHLVGRAGSTGDEIGARLISARLVRDLMRLVFLYERRYAPYAKWFGRGFAECRAAEELAPHLERALAAGDWETRDRALARAYRRVGILHNESGLTDPIDPEPQQFFGRPFSVLAIRGHAEALLRTVDARWLDEVLRRSPIGGIDFVSDNTDVREDPALRRAIRGLYDSDLHGG